MIELRNPRADAATLVPACGASRVRTTTGQGSPERDAVQAIPQPRKMAA